MPAPRRTRPRTAIATHLANALRELARLVWFALLRVWDELRDAAALGPRELARRVGILALRLTGYLATAALAFVLLTALVAAHHSSFLLRAGAGVLVVFAIPLALWRMPLLSERRGVATAWNGLLALALLLACGRDLGGAVRRHGDWFLGQRSDRSARMMRATVGGVGALFEWFTPPAELISHELPIEQAPPFYGTWRDGEAPYPPEPVRVRWVHPLFEPTRTLPAFESRRFGAVRPQPRPWECELGHCGVDLAAPLGAPVVAASDGVVERIERDASAGGRAGRYVRIAHDGGSIVTRYIHLDRIRKELRPGQHVAAGELIGTVGRTGVVENFPHLHFGLSRRAADGSERYIDPEPFLRRWELSDEASPSLLPALIIARR